MPRKTKGKTKLNSASAALEWLERGIKPIPIKPGQKKPMGSAWQKLRLKAKDLPEYFPLGCNIGGLWGRPSGWIVDVDLDDEHAADLAEFLLPRTFIFGRVSRPETHYLYFSKGATTHKWTDTKKKMLVELRSTGTQTVLPPSLHPDKERYQVDDFNDDEFAGVPRVKLIRYLNELAAGALFIRNYPDSSGSRHDYVHAMTGALLWSKWKPEEARRFMKAIVYAVQDREDEPKQRLRTIENTLEHFREGHRIMGWKTLKDWIKPGDLLRMRGWIENKAATEGLPDITVTSKELPPFSPNQLPAFDRSLLDVPGLVGDVTRWSAKQTYLEQPMFDLATGLMCTALASANHYEVDSWNTPLQPYFMLVAPTATGKGASLDRVYEFATKIGLGDHVYQHFQSYHSMMDELANSPNMACWLWDEAARHLKSARSTSSQDYQILSHLIALYGRANKHVPGVPGRKNPIPPLDNPFLTLFATAQPSQLVESISSESMSTGFVNRFILFDAGQEVPQRNQKRESVFPSAMKRMAKTLRSHEPKKTFTTVRFADVEAFSLFDDYAERARQEIKSGGISEVWGRANQNALVVAGIVAVGISPNRPKIDAQTASWAIRLVTWSITSWMARIEDLSSENYRESQSKKVEGYIRNPKSLIGNRTRPKQRALLLKGLVPKSMLTLKLRSLSGRDVEDILDQLLSAGLIGKGEEDDGTTVYWPKS